MSSNPLPTPQVPKPTKPVDQPAKPAAPAAPTTSTSLPPAQTSQNPVPTVSITPPPAAPTQAGQSKDTKADTKAIDIPTTTKPIASTTPAQTPTSTPTAPAASLSAAKPGDIPTAPVPPGKPAGPVSPVAPAPLKPITVNPPKSSAPTPIAGTPLPKPSVPPVTPTPGATGVTPGAKPPMASITPPAAPVVPPSLAKPGVIAPQLPAASTLPKPPGAPAVTPAGIPPAPGVAKPGPASPPASIPAPPSAPAQGAPGGNNGKNTPVFASSKRSFMSFLPFVAIGAVILAIVGWVAWRFLAAPKTAPTSNNSGTTNTGTTPNTQRQVVPGNTTKITYWGLWEPSAVFTEVIQDFEKANPGVTVEYVQQSNKDYRERLQTAIASGTGPDVFRFHASWTPMLRNELAAVPANIFSVNEFRDTFYPVALQQLQLNNQIVGVPLMYDGLALYYNKDIFQTAGAKPPTTWAEVRALALQLTVRSGDQIQRGGLAAGNASNVEHFPEILALLMLQNGADLSNPTSPEAKDALTFYTNFVRQDKVWDSRLPNSTVAFARGEVAMMFAPSWRAHEIKALNPDLDFATMPVPTLADTKITVATYWAEGVNNKGKNKDASWKFIDYLASKDVQLKLYAEQSQARSFGEPYSRKELANQVVNDPYVAAYLSDAPNAQGTYLNSATHDNGINDQLIKYYTDAVNESLNRGVSDSVLETLDLGTQQVLRQYGVTTTSSTGTTDTSR